MCMHDTTNMYPEVGYTYIHVVHVSVRRNTAATALSITTVQAGLLLSVLSVDVEKNKVKKKGGFIGFMFLMWR